MEQAMKFGRIEALPLERAAEPLRWVRRRELGAAPRPWGARQVWTVRRRAR